MTGNRPVIWQQQISHGQRDRRRQRRRRRHPVRNAALMAAVLGSFIGWYETGRIAGWLGLVVMTAAAVLVLPVLLLVLWFVPEIIRGLVPRPVRIRRRTRYEKLREAHGDDVRIPWFARWRYEKRKQPGVWLRRAVYAADRWRCVFCKSDASREIDHIRAWRAGGLTALWNLMTLCKRCNDVKSNYNVDRDGFVHYRAWGGLNDPQLAAKILAKERRARLNPLRWVRAAWILE